MLRALVLGSILTVHYFEFFGEQWTIVLLKKKLKRKVPLASVFGVNNVLDVFRLSPVNDNTI